MARLLIMSKGEWSKSQHGVWRFKDDLAVMAQSILVRRSEEYPSLELKVHSIYNLGRQVPLVVTFQLPQRMVETDVETVPLKPFGQTGTLTCYSASPFTIGRRTYLGECVTEEQHLAMINAIMTEGRITCREEVIREFNDPEKLMLMYRFSMEVEKARKSLDLNVDVQINHDDHIVPNVNNPSIVNQPPPDGNQINGVGGFTGISPVTVLRNTYAPSPYVRMFGYVPHDETPYWEMRHGYYERLMASNYSLNIGRIYGVPGSEFTANPQYQVPVEVSSTASSTKLNAGVELRDPINNSTLRTESKYGNLISEKGESSRENGDGIIKGEMQYAIDVTTQIAQRNADGVSDGTRSGEQGDK
ncbi:unnamed protein product [Eruca vesicaria subsp. sativa]|uniref:Uncharacterized protein n=1 Tax=Eruca vesicaria subsp. sativa TaxID=29727 RepID=A0ABC8KER1_ERUVS|nr:unnamed protein product [Eruca vesicaria subsp. sativa]